MWLLKKPPSHEGAKRLELRPGKSEVSVTKEFAKQLESDPVVLAMVREGTLRFPDIESFEEIHATREGDIARRVKRITKAPIDEEEAVESGADAAKVKSLEAQVKALTQVVEGLTDAGKTAKQATTKKATTKKAADKTAGGK